MVGVHCHIPVASVSNFICPKIFWFSWQKRTWREGGALPPRNHARNQNCTNRELPHHSVNQFRKMVSITIALLIIIILRACLHKTSSVPAGGCGWINTLNACKEIFQHLKILYRQRIWRSVFTVVGFVLASTFEEYLILICFDEFFHRQLTGYCINEWSSTKSALDLQHKWLIFLLS
jgi:hypothetical protein